MKYLSVRTIKGRANPSLCVWNDLSKGWIEVAWFKGLASAIEFLEAVEKEKKKNKGGTDV